MNDYYVYVYIDPRNHEEFYYGKGQGSRKDAHLTDQSDTDKAKRIKAIKREGLEPIVRVIARGLSEAEAFLVEKTLLWKLGKWTTNISTGHFADKFRPHNTLHRELSGFDFHHGIYYYNVGESTHRNWDDYTEFGFISAGQAKRFRDAMRRFNEGDVFAAYLEFIRKDIESKESFVIHWKCRWGGGTPCGQKRTGRDTTAASRGTRAT